MLRRQSRRSRSERRRVLDTTLSGQGSIRLQDLWIPAVVRGFAAGAVASLGSEMHQRLGALELALPVVSASKWLFAGAGRQKNGAPAWLRAPDRSPGQAFRNASPSGWISRQHRKQELLPVFIEEVAGDAEICRALSVGRVFAKADRLGAGQGILRHNRIVHGKHDDGRRRSLFGNYGRYKDCVGSARVLGRDLSLLRGDASGLCRHLRSASATLVLRLLPGYTGR